MSPAGYKSEPGVVRFVNWVESQSESKDNPMRNLLLTPAAGVLLLCSAVAAVAQAGMPDVRELKVVTQLPPELPQRIMGLAYDGEELWATIYLGRGTYAKLDPGTLKWTAETDLKHTTLISTAAGAFGSPGGVCFAKGKVWIAGAYGESFGSIDRETWKIESIFRGKQRQDPKNASQTYSSIAFDGSNLWIAWHWFRYDQPVSQTQRILKIDPESGQLLAQYPVPAGNHNDATHGLTWDGTRLWHMKDQRLSAIDPTTGSVTAQYVIDGVKRPSGLAWAKDSLWIAEFGGKIWRLPFTR
jgi:hypothetical protein